MSHKWWHFGKSNEEKRLEELRAQEAAIVDLGEGAIELKKDELKAIQEEIKSLQTGTGGGGGESFDAGTDYGGNATKYIINLAKNVGINEALKIATQRGLPVGTALWALNTPIGRNLRGDASAMFGDISNALFPTGQGGYPTVVDNKVWPVYNNQGIMDKLIRHGAAESMKRAGVDLSGRPVTAPLAPTPPVSGPHGGGGGFRQDRGPSEAQQRFERSGADANRGFTRTRYGKAYQHGGVVSLMDLLNRRI